MSSPFISTIARLTPTGPYPQIHGPFISQDREDQAEAAARQELKRQAEAEARLQQQGEEADKRRRRAVHASAGEGLYTATTGCQLAGRLP